MSKQRSTLIGAVAGLLALASGSAFLLSKAPDHGSGIEGRVISGCDQIGCPPPHPVVGIQRVFRGTDPEARLPMVNSFRSGKDGTFRVALAPGQYWIEEDPASRAEGVLKPVEVVVRKGEFTERDLFYRLPTG